MSADLETFKFFGEAAAIGLLVGIERYKSRAADERKSAGVRTFTVVALLGAVCALLDVPTFTAMTFGALLVLLGLGYYRESVEHLGLTTEIAGLLTFWLGFLVESHETLAIGTAIVLVTLLAHKKGLHDFVKGNVSELELYDTLKFLLVVFVVLPLLPNRSLGPYEFFNPARVWLLVIVVSTISYSGYVLLRVLGGSRGLHVNALVGGLVSTTAVTASLSERAHRAPELSRLLGVTSVMANAVQFPRLLVLIWIVDRELALYMALPLLGMFAVGLAGAWLLGWLRGVWTEQPPLEVLLQNPYSFWPALSFALLLVGVLLFARLAGAWLGEPGVYLASLVAGLADASAISLSVADMAYDGTLTVFGASTAVFLAVTANALFKWVLSLVKGNRTMALWMGGGFVTMLGAGALLLTAMYLLSTPAS